MSLPVCDHNIKISFFGYRMSGKTTLFNLWCGNHSNIDYVKTTEMEFFDTSLSVDGIDIPITLSDWSYDGMMSCTSSQQTNISAYTENTDIQIFVVAVDSSESFDFAEDAPNSVFF
ncbi:Small GTP-binding protein domain containing protein [Entamoeba marina]